MRKVLGILESSHIPVDILLKSEDFRRWCAVTEYQTYKRKKSYMPFVTLAIMGLGRLVNSYELLACCLNSHLKHTSRLMFLMFVPRQQCYLGELVEVLGTM